VAVLIGLAGCVKFDVALSLSGDTVSGTMIVAVDRQLLAISGQSVDQVLAQMNSSVPTDKGVTSADYSDDKYVGKKFTLSAVPLDTMNSGNTSSDDLKITHDKTAGTYTVAGNLDLSSSDLSDPQVAQFMNSFEVKVAITFPGEVISTDGTKDGTTVTWQPKIGQKNPINAVAKDTGGGGIAGMSTGMLLGIGIPVIVAIVGLILFLAMRKRKQPEAAPVGAYPGVEGGYPPPGYPQAPGSYPPPTGVGEAQTLGPMEHPSVYPPQEPPTNLMPPQQPPGYPPAQ
jgi:hypothetical protein